LSLGLPADGGKVLPAGRVARAAGAESPTSVMRTAR
jgi:hypothetical protein